MTADANASGLAAAFPPFPAECREFLLGYSGGLDSTALLHFLANDRHAAVRAIHIHHGLHPEADRWAEHCRTVCAALGVTLDIVRVQVARDSGEGLEAAARHARYAAFAAALRDGECLVTAHHQDDQAETVLLRLLRASGAGGLAAMRPLRAFANGRHWRPLLDVPRHVLTGYARTQGLSWIEDPANADPHHDRNFLRQRIMPLLHERWPHADANLALSAMLLSDHQGLLDQQASKLLAKIQGVDPATLSVPALLQSPTPWRALILRQWIASLHLPRLPRVGVEKIERELLTARADARAEFRWHGAVIRRWRDILHAETIVPDLPSDWRAGWDGSAPVRLPTGAEFRFDSAGSPAITSSDQAQPFLLSARQGGERIQLPACTHSSEVKTALQDLGIPPWQRRRLPFVMAADGELLAVGDVLLSARSLAAGHRFRLVEPADVR